MVDYRVIHDNELILLFQKGDAAAFTELYERYWQLLYQFAYKRLGREDDAKDVVQEVFISFWKRRRKLQIQTNVQAYLTGAIKFEVLDKIAASLKSKQKKAYYTEHILPHFTAPADPLQQKEIIQQFEQQVQKLPGRMKEVYFLRKEENLTLREIAERLQLSEQTVKNQLGLALKKLRTGLKETLFFIVWLLGQLLS